MKTWPPQRGDQHHATASIKTERRHHADTPSVLMCPLGTQPYRKHSIRNALSPQAAEPGLRYIH
jgi:hypothetical protein